MYNKNRFRKVNEKKVLHKIGKRWIVMSVSLLGALGIGALATRVARADVQGTPSLASSAQGQTMSGRASLVTSQSTSASAVNNSNNNLQSSGKNLSNQVRTLYQQIISNAQRNVSLHQTAPVDGNAVQNIKQSPSEANHTVINGQWGTAPFSFDPKSGLLQTTGKGVITPIEQLGQDNNQFKLQNIKDIRFAPGTQAPVSTKLSDGSLFGVQLEPVQTTDGPSDSTAYVSELCNLSDIDCTNLDTSDMTNMGGMFKNDTGLKRIQFGPHFNTRNVTEMSVMFYNDINLQSLDLSSFDTHNILGMTSMFQSDYALSDLNLGPNFNTGKVAYMSDVFHSDNSLKNLNLGDQFYVSNGYNNDSVDLSDMFLNDYSLKSLNLGSHFNTSHVNNMSDMFANDSDLDSLDLGDQFYTAQVPDMHNMFKGDTDLQSLNLGSHFDTLTASKKNFKSNNGVTSTVYNGARDVFAGDDSLNRLKMNDTRLAGPVNLPRSVLATWRQLKNSQPSESNVNFADGNFHSGDYEKYATQPVQKTCLNLVDQNGRSIGDVFVNGLAGINIPFAAISNALGDGYEPVITTHDIITTYPNSPYKYVAGVIKVNVIKKGGSSYNGNSAPVSGAASQNAVDSYAASVADQSIESSEMKSVASSVAVANSDKARDAAQLADERITASLKRSVADSVATANQSVAHKAAQVADQKVAASLSNSVTASVSVANQSRADRAAKLADQRIVKSVSTSVSASVSVADQAKASQAASIADASLESSIAKSYARSADQSITDSTKASTSASVSVANQMRASRAAELADQRIQSSIAASAASSADAKIASSERASVADSVANANRNRVSQAVKSSDQRIATSLSNSVLASVSLADQSRATRAASSADAELESSIATSTMQSADERITDSLRASVSSSVAQANQAEADRVAHRADQRIQSSIAASAASSADAKIASSERASVINSVSVANVSVARSAAQSADLKIDASLRSSVSVSVSIDDRQDAERAALSADSQLDSSYAASGAHSADQQIDRSIANSYAKAADAQIESSLQASILDSLSAVNNQITQVNNSLNRTQIKESSSAVVNSGLNRLSSQNDSVNQSISESEIGSQNVNLRTSQAVSSDELWPQSQPLINQNQSSSAAPVSSVSSSAANSFTQAPRSSRNLNLIKRSAVRNVHADKAKVTRVPVRRRYFKVLRTCLAHKHIWSVGVIKDYSAVLHRHVTGWIERAFRVQRGHRRYYRYEIRLGRRRCFITANRFFVMTSRRRVHKVHRHQVHRF